MSKMLTSDEAVIVRTIQESVAEFSEVGLFSFDMVVEKYKAVRERYNELKAAFPSVAQAAEKYYSVEIPEDVEFAEDSGYSEALFWAFTSLLGFIESRTFSSFASSILRLNDDLYDLSTFSENFDVDRGSWR